VIEAKFEKAFMDAVKKHSALKKQIEKKVQMILEHPIALGEPLKGNFRGFYSCPVKKSYLIIYLYCAICRKKGDAAIVACADCSETPDETVKFVLFAPHDDAYGI
jgi:addiction module RelE/StbE family toxin